MEKLLKVQKELKAPKNQNNSFGKYKYRSCEDILEVAKPLCVENGLLLTLSDEVLAVADRIYIKATAKVLDIENDKAIEIYAYARESLVKKGMDDSQITGTASSYARKYALNGLFCIDDTKDADTDEYAKRTKENVKKEVTAPPPTPPPTPTNDNVITQQQIKLINVLAAKKGFEPVQFKDWLKSKFAVDSLKKLDKNKASLLIAELQALEDKKE